MADHTEEECKINEQKNLKPENDCGHYVPEGPGTVDLGGDLNTYTEKNGDKVIVSDVPKHNLDQDVSHGPGVEGK